MKSKLLGAAVSLCSTAALVLSGVSIPPEKLATADAASSTTTVSNPLIWAGVPDDDIIRVGDTYYMVSTTMYFSPGAPIMKSKDLVSWEICNYVYDTYANGDVQNLANGKHDYAHGQWAASLRYHKGKFYVFFGSYGSGKSYIYQTSDIENGTWTRSEINGMYHDASILFDDDGRNYLVHGSGGTCNIKELNSDMTGFKSGGVDKVLFKTTFNNLAGEGWHIQKINGYYYIFGIAWPSTSGRIEFCYRSKELLGTYEWKTVLNSGLGTYGSGVAQGGIVDTPDGQWYGLLFQDHGSVGRIPVLVPVTWQNDWPMMGVNGKAPLTFEIEGGTTGTQLANSDQFSYDSNKLALEWQWNHNPDNKSWSVTERDGYLRLHNNTVASNIFWARNTLTQRTEGPSCSSIIKLDTKGMKVGDHAGLSAFQLRYGNVGVFVDNDGSKKVYMSINDGGKEVSDCVEKKVEQINMTGDEVYLKANFRYNTVDSAGNCSNNIDKATFQYSFDGSNWKNIGKELSMSYDLKLFTGYRSAIYSYPTKSTGGYADIDYFDYEREEWNAPNVVEPDPNGYFFHDTFESGTDKWSGRGSASVETSSSAKYEGSKSLYTSGREANWNGASKALSASTFKPGEKYSFSADVMYNSGPASQKFYLSFQYKNAEGTVTYDKIDIQTAVKGEWLQLKNTEFQIPADASEMYIYVETEKGTDSFYVDEVIGAPAGKEIDGPAPISISPGDINCDGRFNVFDLILAKRAIVSGKFSNDIAKNNADVDQDGDFTISDVVLINNFLLGRITEFPVVEKPHTSKTMAEYTEVVKANVKESEPNDSHNEKAGVQYGTVKKASYYSTTCKRQKDYNILLPAGYSEDKKYPVLYVLHGYYENPDRMIIKGNGTMYTRQIIGNAIAAGEAKDMIVVFPDVFSSDTLKSCTGMDDTNNRAYDNFINDLQKDLMPEIASKYSILEGKDNTAVTGFSMGGRESLLIGMKLPDKFGYIGAICPAPGVTGAFKWDADNEPYLLHITAGSNDTVVYDNPKTYHDNFTKNGVPHIWQYVNGGYHGDNSIHAHIYNFVREVFKATD